MDNKVKRTVHTIPFIREKTRDGALDNSTA